MTSTVTVQSHRAMPAPSSRGARAKSARWKRPAREGGGPSTPASHLGESRPGPLQGFLHALRDDKGELPPPGAKDVGVSHHKRNQEADCPSRWRERAAPGPVEGLAAEHTSTGRRAGGDFGSGPGQGPTASRWRQFPPAGGSNRMHLAPLLEPRPEGERDGAGLAVGGMACAIGRPPRERR
jgi:hypothetical protein